MSSTKNVLRIGFIDLLAGFMVASVTLMIIIKYGKEQGSEIAGYPKDYILYTVQLSFQGTPPANLNLEDLFFQFQIKSPKGDFIESVISRAGNKLHSKTKFIEFKGDIDKLNFYGLGPALPSSKDKEKLLYHIYGFQETIPDEEWIVGLRYYSNKILEMNELTKENWDEIVNSKILVEHKIDHINSSAEKTKYDTSTLVLGESLKLNLKYSN